MLSTPRGGACTPESMSRKRLLLLGWDLKRVRRGRTRGDCKRSHDDPDWLRVFCGGTDKAGSNPAMTSRNQARPLSLSLIPSGSSGLQDGAAWKADTQGWVDTAETVPAHWHSRVPTIIRDSVRTPSLQTIALPSGIRQLHAELRVNPRQKSAYTDKPAVES
jgi:hypothetical protein